jgi:hypothetical protein
MGENVKPSSLENGFWRDAGNGNRDIALLIAAR